MSAYRLGNAQADVREFHAAFDVVIGDTPAIRRPMLRKALLAEEFTETITAIDSNNLADAVDGICDLIYVALGTLVEFGVDVEPHWRAVHAANMAKAGGGVREDGKRLKPPGWRPPDHDTLLRLQGWPSGVGES